MTAIQVEMSAVSYFLHRHLLTLIVLSDALAASLPGPGLWLKEANVLDLAGLGDRAAFTTPELLLWLLLFNAGLRTRADRIGQVARRPGMMLAGLAANTSIIHPPPAAAVEITAA